MTPVTVMRDKFARSWPELDPDKPVRSTDRVHVLNLGEALERDYRGDAHFAAYRSTTGYRMNVETLGVVETIELTSIVFDVDGPKHAATETWRRGLREKLLALAEIHPSPFYYETRGGARILYRQEEPTILRSRDDGRAWSQVYAVAVAYLARRFGIEADPACNDWQRLYRLPRATRDLGGRPENWPTMGDPRSIGTLVIDAEHADVDAAKRASRAFREPRNRPITPSGCAGDGLLYHLVRARGDVGRDAPRGGWVVRCPNRHEHTSDTDGTDSTVLYPPDQGGELGFICCKHAHCTNLVAKEWLRFFPDSEIETARRAAGITRAA